MNNMEITPHMAKVIQTTRTPKLRPTCKVVIQKACVYHIKVVIQKACVYVSHQIKLH